MLAILSALCTHPPLHKHTMFYTLFPLPWLPCPHSFSNFTPLTWGSYSSSLRTQFAFTSSGKPSWPSSGGLVVVLLGFHSNDVFKFVILTVLETRWKLEPFLSHQCFSSAPQNLENNGSAFVWTVSTKEDKWRWPRKEWTKLVNYRIQLLSLYYTLYIHHHNKYSFSLLSWWFPVL